MVVSFWIGALYSQFFYYVCFINTTGYSEIDE